MEYSDSDLDDMDNQNSQIDEEKIVPFGMTEVQNFINHTMDGRVSWLYQVTTKDTCIPAPKNRIQLFEYLVAWSPPLADVLL